MTRKPDQSDHLPYKVPILSSRYARRFARFMESKGIGPKAFLSGTGVTERMLNDPDAFLTMDDTISILRQSQALLDDERAPFQFGQQLDFPAHGLLGYALVRQQSQSKLTQMIVQHLRVSLPVMDMEVSTTSRNILIHLRDTWDLGEVRSFMAKIYMGSIYSLASQVCHQIRFECDFSCRLEPASWRRIARCADIRFDCGSNQVIMPLSDRTTWEREVDASYVLAKERARQMMQPDNVRDIVAKVRDAVSYSPGNGSSLERVARKLGMSARSLRNHLAEAGASFRDIRSEIREAYATRYLTDTKLSLDIIAEKVGFSDQAAFTRAYRNWTGRTPGEVRRRANQQAD